MTDNAPTNGFDYFKFVRAVLHDERLTQGVKFVLQNIALVYLKYNGDHLLYAKQTTIAECLGVSIRLVKQAYKAADDHGYFVVETERQRGRRHHAPNTYRLVIPADTTPVDGQEIGAPDEPISHEIGAPDDGNRCTNPPEIGARDDRNRCTGQVSDQGERPHGTVYKGRYLRDGGEGTAPPPPSLRLVGEPAASGRSRSAGPPGRQKDGEPYRGPDIPLNDEDEFHAWDWESFILRSDFPDIPVDKPPRFCDRHSTGTSDPCGGCKDRKKLLEDWESVRAEWIEHNRDAAEFIRDCKYCRKSKGLYRDQYGLWWCEHPTDPPPEDQGRIYEGRQRK